MDETATGNSSGLKAIGYRKGSGFAASGSSKKSMKNRSKMSMKRSSKRTISARVFGFGN